MTDIDDGTIEASQIANDAFEANHATDQPLGPTSISDALAINGAAPTAGPPTTKTKTTLKFIDNPLETPHKHGKLINDPIHGCYRLDPIMSSIFDTAEFQRLRRLKQLGMTYYVFPGASHNRFEHSLGVAHLALRFTNQLWQAQRNELDTVSPSDIRNVGLAGLCHDLGHGPFSHVFDREFLRRRGITDWEHEDMSAMMLDHILDVNHIDALDSARVKRIKELITCGHQQPSGGGGSESHANTPSASPAGTAGAPPTSTASATNRWLGEIVANGRNSIDVDKFDYLARDSMYCGTKIAFDFNRTMQFSRVIGDEICYKYTEYMNLYELFHARAYMHRSVYTHKKAKAIEFMVVDALLAAEPALKICNKIRDPAQFKLLDDGIVDIIENFEVLGLGDRVDEGYHSCLRDAQSIIARVRNRQLYKYVADALVPSEIVMSGRWTPPTPEDVVSYHSNNGDVDLRVDDVIIQENKIDYSMASQNPLDSVHFYDYIGDTNKRKLRPDQISSMVVSAFQEKRIRVYSRNSDPRVVAALHAAFERWLEKRFGGSVVASTPAKAPPAAVDHYHQSALGRGGIKRGRNLFGNGQPPLPPAPKRPN